VTPSVDGQPAELAAIRIRDSDSHTVEDVLSVTLIDPSAPWASTMKPPTTPALCAEALNFLLEDSVLAAWDVEQVLSDLEDVLGEATSAVDIGDHRPLEVASLARPFVGATDQIDDACEWADVPAPPTDSASALACAALAISRRAFDVARMGNRVAADHGATLFTH
jgi:hypothetical protein